MSNSSNSPLRILMLGWEYPPHIAGGLGVACEGLTKSLCKTQDVEIHFVVPKLFGGEQAPHMFLHDSFERLSSSEEDPSITVFSGFQTHSSVVLHSDSSLCSQTLSVLSYSNPRESDYLTHNWLVNILSSTQFTNEFLLSRLDCSINDEQSEITSKAHYGRNVFEEVARYTSRVIRNFSGFSFDIIHAHDWMTYAAGVALQRISGKPLVVHTHSLDFDRSGNNKNEAVFQIERLGIHAAQRVISVSHYTKSLVVREYGIAPDKISVVHNGVNPKSRFPRKPKTKRALTVLFLGRITMQKGPDYYIRAAARVLSVLPDTRFYLAGKGDMLPGMIELAHDLGIGGHFEFLGFLDEAEVEEVFAEADLYIMPSVSEPFGISALESINFDTPVIMSRQSGVSEVVSNSLKFDFWDVDRLADLIINGLIHEDLRADLISSAKSELTLLHWDAAATKTRETYNHVLNN